MSTLKYFIFGLCAYSCILSCNDNPELLTGGSLVNHSDSIKKTCLSSFEYIIDGKPDTINKAYGSAKVKQGHWIIYELIGDKEWSGERVNAKTNKLERIKTEDGYYRNNKKEGYWKRYNKDGTIKDSLQYENDIVVTN